MATEYYLDEALSAVVTEVIDEPAHSEFEPLRNFETQFLVAAVRKTNSQDETQPTSGMPVVARKISPADRVFLPGCHYKLYVDMHRWEAANENQRRAMVHEGLMRINAEQKEQGIKYSTRRPDVETYQATVVRYGAWKEPLLLLRENLGNAQRKATELAGKNKK